jgi:hypothetical protein
MTVVFASEDLGNITDQMPAVPHPLDCGLKCQDTLVAVNNRRMMGVLSRACLMETGSPLPWR